MMPRNSLMVLVWVWILCGIVSISNQAHAAGVISPCSAMLPAALSAVVKEKYPGFKIPSLRLLENYHRKLFQKDHKGKCPGIARVNFYGTGKNVYAIVVTKPFNGTFTSNLLLAQETDKQEWRVTMLEQGTTGPVPVVVSGSAGKYEDVYERRTIQAQYEVIAYIGYESWAVVYVWNGKEIEKIQITD